MFLLTFFIFLFISDNFSTHKVDGRLLLEIDETFAKETLLIPHALKRRKLISLVEKLKLRKKKDLEVRQSKEKHFFVFIIFYSSSAIFALDCLVSPSNRIFSIIFVPIYSFYPPSRRLPFSPSPFSPCFAFLEQNSGWLGRVRAALRNSSNQGTYTHILLVHRILFYF